MSERFRLLITHLSGGRVRFTVVEMRPGRAAAARQLGIHSVPLPIPSSIKCVLYRGLPAAAADDRSPGIIEFERLEEIVAAMNNMVLAFHARTPQEVFDKLLENIK